MDQENLQQVALDEALVPIVDQVKIGSCSMRIDLLKTQKEPNYQLTQDILKQYSCYNAFIITVDVPQTYMQQFCSFINTIKYDSVLGKLKFVNKGEKHQKNGMSIPDSMMNDKIKSSVPYQTYLTLSTGTKVQILKVGKGGKGKRLMGKKKPNTGVQHEEKKNATTLRKKSSITADDNIIPDPDEALKLDTAESEETEDDEVQPLIRRSTGVFIGIEIPNEKTKDAFDHSKKLKRMETLPPAAQLVPDEPKDISGNSSSSRSGFDDETKDISSNDEIKADENKAEEGKAIEEQAGEEPPVDE
ncbi:hypothetical protein Tco_1273984 [Tanacetum coccineum]